MRSSPTVQSEEGEPLADELARYLAIPVESSPDNPLTWWNDHHLDFPVLSKLAYDYLSCPAMSAECERIFSRVNLLVTDDRRSLLTTSVEAEVLLHKWQLEGLIIINKDNSYDRWMANELAQLQRIG